MKEQLITFDTAKLAKEKEFDIIVDYIYGMQNIPQTEVYNDATYKLYKDRLFLAPTQSLLQKWLRDKHGIHIQVYVMEAWLNTGNEMEVYFEVNLKTTNNLKGISNVKSNMLQFKAYEEALEKGLQEALKLIK
jgi:hypothetical protein